jgi:dTDP-4-amino-4,6-dideoxygalactose transaminase
MTPDDFPHTEAAYQGLLSLPLYPDLTEVEQDIVVEVLAGLT